MSAIVKNKNNKIKWVWPMSAIAKKIYLQKIIIIKKRACGLDVP